MNSPFYYTRSVLQEISELKVGDTISVFSGQLSRCARIIIPLTKEDGYNLTVLHNILYAFRIKEIKNKSVPDSNS